MTIQVRWMVLDAGEDHGEPGCYEFQWRSARIWVEHLGPGQFLITAWVATSPEASSVSEDLERFLQPYLSQICSGQIRPSRGIAWF
ncbi:MAG: hypothetical protein J7452_12950 [Thermoflexus sp.]|jgi:hypothetical protein|nr:hypothetical protein [Thermoflexus sp.]